MAIAAVTAGVVVAWKGPSARVSPLAYAKQLFGTLAPAGAVVGGAFGFVECVSEVTRNRVDVPNAMIGGCAAGLTLGMYRKSMASAALGCLAMGTAAGVTDANKYFFAPAPAVAHEMKHVEDLQTSSESVDSFVSAEMQA